MKLRELRKEKKLTQSNIASMLSVSTRTYGGYEIGDSEPSIHTLITLADFYNTTIDYLVGRPTRHVNLFALPEEKREIFEVVLNLNEPETKKVHAFIAGFASAKNEWPASSSKPSINQNTTNFKN